MGFACSEDQSFFNGSFSAGSHLAVLLKLFFSRFSLQAVLLKVFSSSGSPQAVPIIRVSLFEKPACRLVLSLHVMQLLVVAVDLEQFVVCATFHDLSFVEHAYLVSVFDC